MLSIIADLFGLAVGLYTLAAGLNSLWKKRNAKRKAEQEGSDDPSA